MNAPRRYDDMAEFQASLPPPKPVPYWLAMLLIGAWLGLLFVGIYCVTQPAPPAAHTAAGIHHSEEK